MAEFTREQLIAEVHYNLEHCFCSEKTKRLMEIALAALTAGMEQEPVYQVQHGDQWRDLNKTQYDDHVNLGAEGLRILYAAPQLPQPAVVVSEAQSKKLFDEWSGGDGALGELRASGVPDEFISMLKEFSLATWEACREAMLKHSATFIVTSDHRMMEMPKVEGIDAVADMLQGAEPASNCDELPLDYLQGHKDALEWAAQLAEANHPQTGDWLYDDPIELARAIRKGPDMPTSQAGNSPVTPDSWVMVPKEPTEAMNKAGWAAMNEHDAINPTYRAMLAAAPKAPDGWIQVSERMPEGMTDVHISNGHDVGQGWWDGDTWQTQHDYYSVPGDVTHWMPLPAAPQQEVKNG